VQDPKTKNWYIYIGNKKIGYYPASLFSNLKSANLVMWTGKTITPTHIPCPPMGSGVQPNGVLGHACYFKNLAFFNDSLKYQRLEKDMGQIQSSNRECYGAAYYDVDKIGSTIQFGGPGGGSVNPTISGTSSERVKWSYWSYFNIILSFFSLEIINDLMIYL
jgi:hypothetical protein